MRRVLYIEDNEDNAYLVRMRLELLGEFQVFLSKDAPSGIEAAKTVRPDIILMDMDLPGMSGPDAIKVLKESPETADIPVIAVTAHAMEGTRITALRQGFDEYCAKPIDFRKLLEMLQKMTPYMPE
jgi:CheY-like chemotaxis protein